MEVYHAEGHEFVDNSKADIMAKIQELKAESNLVARNISNNTLSSWHVSRSHLYWGQNETHLLDQKDPPLASNISNAIHNLQSLSDQQNVGITDANQAVNNLDQLLDTAQLEIVGSEDQHNATIQALALVGVLNEALRDYGTAIGSKVDLTNMNNMNMSAVSGSSSGGSMPGMHVASRSVPIVNMAAYQSAQAFAGDAQEMFNNLKSIAPSSTSVYLDKAGTALNQLNQQISSKDSGNEVMLTVHMHIHPNLISAFNISAVPEFPAPVLLAMISFFGVIVFSRVFYRTWIQRI